MPVPVPRRSRLPAIGIGGGALAACLALVIIGQMFANSISTTPANGEDAGTTTSTAYFDETAVTDATNAPVTSDAIDKNNMTDTGDTYPTMAFTEGFTQPTVQQTTPATVPPTICPTRGTLLELLGGLPMDLTREQIIEAFMKLDCVYAMAEDFYFVYELPHMEYNAAANTIRWKWVKNYMLIADYNLGTMRLEYGNEVLAEKLMNTCHTASETWDMFQKHKSNILPYTIGMPEVERIMSDGWVTPFILDINTVTPERNRRASLADDAPPEVIYMCYFHFEDGGPVIFMENYTLETMTYWIVTKQQENILIDSVPLNPDATPYREFYT